MLRPVTPADAETVALHRYPDDQDAAERPVYAAWVRSAAGRGLYLGVLAEQRGAVVCGAGLVRLEWGPSRGRPAPERLRLVNIWTHPDWRRRGLARQVVEACLHTARAEGIGVVSLGTSEMARGLYESLGFRASTTEMVLKLS